MLYQFFTINFFLMLISIADVWSIPGNCVPIMRSRTAQSSNASRVLEDHKSNSGNTAELGCSPAVGEYSHVSKTHAPSTLGSGNNASVTYSSYHNVSNSVHRSTDDGAGNIERENSSVVRVNSEHRNTHAAVAGVLYVQSGVPTKATSAPQIVRQQCSECKTTIATLPGGEDVCITCKKKEIPYTKSSTHTQYHKSLSAGDIRDYTCNDRVD